MRGYIVADVFTDIPLQGNPVAVFEDGEGLSSCSASAWGCKPCTSRRGRAW